MDSEAVIRLLTQRCREQGSWQITGDELLKLLAPDPVHYYRTLYAIKDKLPLSTALSAFTNENSGELVTFLEALTGRDTEILFVRAGLYLTFTWRMELNEALLSTVGQILAAHIPDWEEAAAMYRHTENLLQAFQLYLATYFLFSEIIAQVSENFYKRTGGEALLKLTAVQYLENLFRRHIFEWDRLFESLYRKFSDRFEPDRVDEADTVLVAALQLFGLSEKTFAGALLKKRYKELMKIYHPDLNPAGLEQTKRINAAYALLLQNCRPA